MFLFDGHVTTFFQSDIFKGKKHERVRELFFPSQSIFGKVVLLGCDV